MRVIYLLILVLFSTMLFAKNGTVDCNAIFEERKKEIQRDLELLEEKRQSIEALKKANDETLNKKEQFLKKREEKLKIESAKIEAIKKETLDIYEKNRKLLQDMQDTKNNKISQTYSKMKDSKAANILNSMDKTKAAKILSHLAPKKIAKIMAKMNPLIASDITKILSSKMEFDLNSTK